MSFVNPLARYTLFLSLFTLITCWQPFPDDTVGDYNDLCADALTTNLTSCVPAVRSISSNNFYSRHGLETICTRGCRDELQAYRRSVVVGCPGVTYTNDWGTVYPITEIADTLLFDFQQTCLRNEGEYCNIVLGNITRNGGDDCNKCLLLKLRNEARYPYGSGPNVYSSAYPSYTSSCGFTGYPVTATATVSLPHLSSTPASSVVATPTASTCSGKKYTIKDGDTCESVSKSQSVATFQLLMDNELQAYCADFPKSGDLCIQSQCTTYTVKKGDTCKSVGKKHNITTVQLRSYNPWIDGGCYNFNRTIGTEICVDEPGEKYHAPSTVIGSATGSATASSAVSVPTNLANNSTKNCGEYFTPKANQTCDTIIQKFPISRANFLVLNPGLNQNCTNLIAGRSYCVKPVDDIDNYPGAPGYMPSVSKIPWSNLPDATYRPIINPDPLPVAPGTVKNCLSLADGRDLQYNFTGFSNCQAAEAFWEISKADLLRWNPSLKKQKLNSTDCNFSKEYRYCMDGGSGASPSSSGAVPSTPAPSTPLQTSTSTPTSLSTSSPTPTSTSMSTSTPQTSTTDTDTSTSSELSSTTRTPTTSSAAVPSPTQSNSIPDNCNDYAEAKEGDNCVDFAKDHDITPEQLYKWNTVLGDDGSECGTMFQKDTYYCIGVSE